MVKEGERMKLTKADRHYLVEEFHEDAQAIDQIERAVGQTWFTYKGERISAARAIELCGRERFLSAMDRSAFHWTTAVPLEDGSVVYFDSSKLFTGRWPRKGDR